MQSSPPHPTHSQQHLHFTVSRQSCPHPGQDFYISPVISPWAILTPGLRMVESSGTIKYMWQGSWIADPSCLHIEIWKRAPLQSFLLTRLPAELPLQTGSVRFRTRALDRKQRLCEHGYWAGFQKFGGSDPVTFMSLLKGKCFTTLVFEYKIIVIICALKIGRRNIMRPVRF